MSFQHRLQENRFELKYIVTEPCARAIRDFARSYLVPDEHADPENGYAYAIHSLYLDSPGLALCNATVQGHKNRFKLRVRYYNDDPDTPVFFEIKRRVNDAILKRRAPVHREQVLALLDGYWPERSALFNPDDAKGWDALQQFCEMRNTLNAQGQCIVSYIREAWVTTENNSVRLTFDRHLHGMPWRRQFVCRQTKEAAEPAIGGVILELKFTDRFPVWMRNLVRVFNLQRTSCAKYVHCVQMLRPLLPGAHRHEVQNVP